MGFKWVTCLRPSICPAPRHVTSRDWGQRSDSWVSRKVAVHRDCGSAGEWAIRPLVVVVVTAAPDTDSSTVNRWRTNWRHTNVVLWLRHERICTCVRSTCMLLVSEFMLLNTYACVYIAVAVIVIFQYAPWPWWQIAMFRLFLFAVPAECCQWRHCLWCTLTGVCYWVGCTTRRLQRRSAASLVRPGRARAASMKRPLTACWITSSWKSVCIICSTNACTYMYMYIIMLYM